MALNWDKIDKEDIRKEMLEIRPGKEWEREDLIKLVTWYGRIPTKEIHTYIIKTRTRGAIQAQASRMGLKSDHHPQAMGIIQKQIDNGIIKRTWVEE